MSQRNNDYERLYNVGLLDDIHNYFPDILYNSGRFSSIQDVLQYLRQNTQERFDLYSFGLRDYQTQHPPQTPPQQERVVSTPPPVRVRIRQAVRESSSAAPSSSSPPAPQTISNSTNHQTTPIRARAYLYHEDEDDAELNQHLQDLVNYMQAPLTRSTRNNGALNLFTSLFSGLNTPAPHPSFRGLDILTRQAESQFMEPVVVRPTPEQIDRGSRVDTLAVASSDNCAICQDSFAAHSNRRTLTVCGHAFHMNCIDTWFEQNVHCPVCRHDIREVEEEQ